MRVITTLALALAKLASLATCNSKFIQPPESTGNDISQNKRYKVGDMVQIEYETDIDQPAIELNQIPLNGVSALESLPRNGSSNPSYWIAEYDSLGLAEDNKDSVYWFTLYKSSKGRIARSEYFNVSSPNAETTSAGVLATLTSAQQESTSTTGPTSEMKAESTTISLPSDESTSTSPSDKTNSGSGLSTGATAGITAGAIIGGLSILGGIGYFVWRRSGKGKNNTGTEGAQDQQHQFYALETKVELPSDITTHPSEYASSRPGLHEAP
ncbi:uncharacterized protein FMAN_12077 [Fusarium mangiferae]|uniref:Uncharacterized protein n=1 Tax=Fusarium mangiferae TaxID=192010 RepID=A0A1L7TSV4_FUSMA|nr:uncharacterized protein FMAN_12077 [Fusarium mangiferae]CVK97886.1 uncharacterized protein FMAN_12077 [Fusarium mangiferae]